MKKRRVLALLLALSLAVSANGMTVFAAETGDLTASAAPPVEDMQDGTKQADAAEADADDKQDIDSENTDNSKETGGDSTEDQAGQEDGGTSGGEDVNADGEQDSGGQSPDTGDVSDAAISGNALPEAEASDAAEPETAEAEEAEEPEEPEAEKDEKLPKMIANEVRMVNFTDDTGMKVAYDANASKQYVYKVKDGVLTAVVTQTTVSGNTIEEPVAFTGNVALEQPAEEKDKYTSVAADVFKGNTDITYVKLPDGVTDIRDNTFQNCTGLKGVYLPAAVTSIGAGAFAGCTSMTQIAVPKAVASIGNSAFKGDTRLYMVYMKNMDYSVLTAIGDSAFEGCSALAEFCSDTEFSIPGRLESIGEKAFYQCKSIEKVDLNTAKLESVGAGAFEECTGLKSASLGKLAQIPVNAFKGCNSLECVAFSGRGSDTIGEYAFAECYSLRQIELPMSVKTVSQCAFAGCTNLSSVEFRNPDTEVKSNAFPVGMTNDCLVFVGEKYYDKSKKDRTRIYVYYLELNSEKIAFVDPNETEENKVQYYTYKVANSEKDGKLRGGQIWVGTEDKTKVEDNINTFHKKKGVPSDGTRYYIYYQADKNYELVRGSLKSNGEEVEQDDKKRYWITMPPGGTVITAEFREKTASPDKIEGIKGDVEIEFSNGETDISRPGWVKIKIGQQTRMFLVDNKSGKTIAPSQIKEIKSGNENYVKVSAAGVITAVGVGDAEILVTLVGGDGREFTVRGTISVVDEKIGSISLKASIDISGVQVTGDPHGIQTAAVNKNYAKDEIKFILKANVYTAEGEVIAKALTWKSSDTSVATVGKDSTTRADTSNVVEIKKGCEGEAVITVTAQIDSKNTVAQKFVVSVQNRTVKLASSSVTVNPNLEKHGELEIISSYGCEWPAGEPKIYRKAGDKYIDTDFWLEAQQGQNGSDKSRRYDIKIVDPKVENGSYKLYVCPGDNQSVYLPLTINVKRSVPAAPTVKFNTKKTKINLFYMNGGTDKDGNPITVTTEVTKLGKAKIRKVELCALSDKPNDKKFEENFEIAGEDLEKGIIPIRKKNQNVRYTEGKNPKAVVTGYLKIYYEGYSDKAAKKVKVTIPTVTTAPAYVLDRTSVTYRDGAGSQTETLRLLDKKTKQPFCSSNVEWRIESGNSIAAAKSGWLESGEIALDISRALKGSVKISLTNPTEWDKDKKGSDRTLSYTFKVKTTGSEPTITAKTITLNRNYPEMAETFYLESSQRDTKLAEKQDFTPADGCDGLEVSYQNGVGSIKIKEGRTVEKGTYKWTCYPVEQGGGRLTKAATLTVKVVDSKPKLKLGKGSLVLNLATAATAADGSKTYEETAEIPLKVTGKPKDYTLDTNVNSGGTGTKIECTTQSGGETHFDWKLQDTSVDQAGKLVDGKLSLSVKNGAPLGVGTYSFKLTAGYVNPENGKAVLSEPMTFQVKLIDTNDISVSFSAKGKLNLVDREGKYTTKNTIIYTPTLKNVRGVIEDAWIYDVNTDKESEYFDIYLNPEDGKLYVTPKKTKVNISPGDDIGTEGGNGTGNEGGSVSGNTTGGEDESVSGNTTGGKDESVSGNTTGGKDESVGGSTAGSGDAGSDSGNRPSGKSGAVQGYEYAALKNNEKYRVKIVVKVAGCYVDDPEDRFHGGVVSKSITIKTAQALPKVKTDKSTLDVFLSNKQYDATFTVTPQAGAPGIVEEIGFGEKDEVPRDAFEISYKEQPDGSLKVIVHLKQAVAYQCGSVNKVKMYIKFKGQGTNTKKTLVNMNIRVNK